MRLRVTGLWRTSFFSASTSCEKWDTHFKSHDKTGWPVVTHFYIRDLSGGTLLHLRSIMRYVIYHVGRGTFLHPGSLMWHISTSEIYHMAHFYFWVLSRGQRWTFIKIFYYRLSLSLKIILINTYLMNYYECNL